ncbi:MAG: methylated-DNA--[protein]-cysteine S-methyltransferase, partial [Vicinamibacterales bacterium]
SRFYEGAGSTLGLLPSSYRKGGAGATIAYATARSPLGDLLVATTDRGVCAVSLGDSAAALHTALRREFPAATLVEDRTRLEPWLAQVIDHLAGSCPRLDLPLDIRATAFQWQVWKALTAIPRGETRTYGEIAKLLGRPSASRAVARACASNRIAIAIPCHRVVPAGGGVGGYRWGIERKSRLLSNERGLKDPPPR